MQASPRVRSRKAAAAAAVDAGAIRLRGRPSAEVSGNPGVGRCHWPTLRRLPKDWPVSGWRPRALRWGSPDLAAGPSATQGPFGPLAEILSAIERATPVKAGCGSRAPHPATGNAAAHHGRRACRPVVEGSGMPSRRDISAVRDQLLAQDKPMSLRERLPLHRRGGSIAMSARIRPIGSGSAGHRRGLLVRDLAEA